MSLMRRAAFSPREAVRWRCVMRSVVLLGQLNANSLQKQLQSAVWFLSDCVLLYELTFCNIKLPVCCLNPSGHQYK